MSRRAPDLVALREGNRAALARAITLVESRRPDHGAQAGELLDQLLPHTGNALRLGISGTPGVGKSTFIEALGKRLADAGERLAVLAVDPSSSRTGGSILGDRTRMFELSRHPNVFIRSSPSGGALGGVADATGDTILLCEAAGYSVILVETVGVGQNETAVADLTDLFLLLVAPGGGDELQGIKRGVMELADVLAVNKADGPTADLAARTANEYRSALSLVRPKWADDPTDVLTCSAQTGTGLEEVWTELRARWRRLDGSGQLAALREQQRHRSFWSKVNRGLLAAVQADTDLHELIATAESEVLALRRSATSAARGIVAEVFAP